MKWAEVRQRSTRESEYLITLLLTNWISLFLTWLLARTRVTPNQVSIASLASGLLAGIFYAFGGFLAGSAFLFLSHILDCTDGNLARVTGRFSRVGRWLDMVGDRSGELFLFLGIGAYFLRHEGPEPWALLSLLGGFLVMLYYYIVDVGAALGLTGGKRRDGSPTGRPRLKWGLYEPVIYGFIVLAPLGLVKVQIGFVLIMVAVGLTYQGVKGFAIRKQEQGESEPAQDGGPAEEKEES
jgi:phosphatidylglycerophosphate synthase